MILSYHHMIRGFLNWRLLAGCFLICSIFFNFSGLAEADTLGQTRLFFVNSQYDAESRTSLNAVLKLTGERAYGFVDESYWQKINETARTQLLDQIYSILKEFDSKIYPMETAFFGSEPNPGIDNDPRLTIVFSPLIDNVGGYFDSASNYPVSDSNKFSNEREMIFINIKFLSDLGRANQFLAHEFQHLISSNQKDLSRRVYDDVWLNELRSEYAISLLGYNDVFPNSSLERRIQTFLKEPADSLTEWKNLGPDYGQVAVFAQYLAEHWPKEIIGQTLNTEKIGIPSVDYALGLNGVSLNFENIFRFWTVANTLNDTTAGELFGYYKEGLKNLRVLPRTFQNMDDASIFVANDQFVDWQARWYEITNFISGNKNVLQIKFSSVSLPSFSASYILFKNDGSKQIGVFSPTSQNEALYLDGVGSDFNKIIVIPFKRDKLSGFSSSETGTSLSLTLERIVATDRSSAATTNLSQFQSGQNNVSVFVKPEDFGLSEGDFIRAEGDNDVFIVNQFGYKRLVLNPKICLQYGHLGKRGCFSAVKTVKIEVRDAFKTSWLVTNGETEDGKIYFLQTVGEDEGVLHHLELSASNFLTLGGNFQSVFRINSLEQKNYLVGSAQKVL